MSDPEILGIALKEVFLETRSLNPGMLSLIRMIRSELMLAAKNGNVEVAWDAVRDGWGNDGEYLFPTWQEMMDKLGESGVIREID